MSLHNGICVIFSGRMTEQKADARNDAKINDCLRKVFNNMGSLHNN